MGGISPGGVFSPHCCGENCAGSRRKAATKPTQFRRNMAAKRRRRLCRHNAARSGELS
jgi:hypothetical protein